MGMSRKNPNHKEYAMKQLRYTTMLFVLISLISPAAWTQDESPKLLKEEYRIGNGDVLFISVWKNDDLTREAIVLPDGTISFPLTGKIEATDKTLDELKQDLEAKLKPFINDPVIAVSIKAINSMNIYVVGRVNIPGRFALFTNVDVLQALSMAGGPNSYADRKNIRIFRKEDGKTICIGFNYKEVTEGIHLEQNIMLKRGDVIVVP
jgi:polysaccharide export outer membrane protein